MVAPKVQPDFWPSFWVARWRQFSETFSASAVVIKLGVYVGIIRRHLLASFLALDNLSESKNGGDECEDEGVRTHLLQPCVKASVRKKLPADNCLSLNAE